MRLTEYHAGVPVIRDKELLPRAMEKLARLEDLADQGDIRETICDEYCKYTHIHSQGALDQVCEECDFAELFRVLEGGERCLQE